MKHKAGILSDTHISRANLHFTQAVKNCFSDCDIIIHAGDLTNISILNTFQDKTIYSVHGNMCDPLTHQQLSESLSFHIGKFSFRLTHGAQLGHDIETRFFELYPETDCLIYGHTHRAVCNKFGNTLIINPGSFCSTGRFGATGTYAILDIDKHLHCTIHNLTNLI